MQADAEELVNALLGRLGDQVPIPPALREAFTKPLGELSGSLRADTSSLTGKLRLTFD
jgi:hypothetical protein